MEYIPGGVNSPVRSFRGVGGTPVFLSRGSGAYVWDADDNRYIDFVGSWGPLILGHSHPAVVEAIKSAATSGASFGAPTSAEIELAQLICEAFPSIEQVRLVNSGTEACMSAIRLARAYTGRNKIIKFSGCYHGHADGLLVQAGSGALSLGVPTSAGVPEGYAAETLVAEYNNLDSVHTHFENHPGQVAGVIVEPVAGNMGVVRPEPGFLGDLCKFSREQGALVIMDEVITGFRVAYGGAQALYGVAADITCLGKIIGGGLPVGAYGGSREIMEMVAPLGPMYQAGTLSGNPIAVQAGLATLKLLKEPGVYEGLDRIAAKLVGGLDLAAREIEEPITTNRIGSMFTSFFTKRPVRNQTDAEKADTERYASFFHGILEMGVYLAPSQFEAGFLSLAHSEEDIEKTVVAAEETFKTMV